MIVELACIQDYKEGGGIYTRRTESPPPHFCLKVVCKKGGCIFGSLRYMHKVLVGGKLTNFTSRKLIDVQNTTKTHQIYDMYFY